MEWQIVTDFFAKMQAKLGSNFSAPDPAQTGTKVDFCTYCELFHISIHTMHANSVLQGSTRGVGTMTIL